MRVSTAVYRYGAVRAVDPAVDGLAVPVTSRKAAPCSPSYPHRILEFIGCAEIADVRDPVAINGNRSHNAPI